MNRVTLYSNGTAVISREYELKDHAPLRITIPVRKTDLDDVISSLSVFGDVTITEPPTYAPTNARETELTLDPGSVFEQIATKLSGALVEIEAGTIYHGKLAGLNRQIRELRESVIDERFLVVLTEKGLQQVRESSVTAIRFIDPTVRAELDKALQVGLSRIRPDSSTMELTILPNAGALRAVVNYATPVAAWKIRYQLRLAAGQAELEGQAVVDNDTDDDWTDTMITVVTGEPITFSTDLAEVRRPARKRVALVADHATGAVVAETPLAATPELESGEESMSALAFTGATSMMSLAPPDFDSMPRASQAQAEVRESGDFNVYQSPNPVTIGAKRSAIIPLFREAVGNPRQVLFYKEDDDPERAFRAVRFVNQSAHTLGRGVCEVLLDGDFQGKCLLESTKPGEESLLIHAKETGVRVFKEEGSPDQRRMAIQISDRTVYCEQLNRQDTVYRVQNSHPAAFTLEIDHARAWQGSSVEITATPGEHEAIDVPSGKRIRVTLEPSGSLFVKVREQEIVKQAFALEASWFQRNVPTLESPASENKAIEKCVELQKRIDSIQAEINEREQAARTLEEDQKRLLKLIPNVHDNQANEWRTDLANNEKELRAIRRVQVPKLKQQLQAARSDLQSALSRLRFAWKADGYERHA